jgi:hypothetical protein
MDWHRQIASDIVLLRITVCAQRVGWSDRSADAFFTFAVPVGISMRRRDRAGSDRGAERHRGRRKPKFIHDLSLSGIRGKVCVTKEFRKGLKEFTVECPINYIKIFVQSFQSAPMCPISSAVARRIEQRSQTKIPLVLLS